MPHRFISPTPAPPKSGDFQNAFCQSTLPPTKQHVIRPLLERPLTPPKTYLQLIKTLYGLKRSPCHWYELATKLFMSLGLVTCPNAPCLSSGHIDGSKEKKSTLVYMSTTSFILVTLTK